MEDSLPQLVLLGRVLLAGILGGLIGLERELKGKAAGVRTQMFVGGAAALLVGLSPVMVERFGDASASDAIRADPIRVIEAIIAGVSFIGAGSIIFRGGSDRVEGITTAASILMTAAVGIAVALDQLLLAVLLAAIVAVVLRVAVGLERALGRHREGE